MQEEDREERHKRWRGRKGDGQAIVVHPAPVVVTPTPPVVVAPTAVTVEAAEVIVPPASVEQSLSIKWATWLMVVTSAAMIVVSFYQWDAMRAQNAQTERLLTQMKNDHAAARREASNVIQQMIADHAVLKDQLKQSGKQLEQNENVLEQMRLEQRAWLGLTGPARLVFEAGKQVEIGLQIQNSGQTPAHVEQVQSRILFLSRKVRFDPRDSALSNESGVEQSVAPGQTIRFPFVPSIEATEKMVEAVKGNNPSHALYFVAKVHYRDVVDRPRITEICLMYDASADELRTHPLHNRIL